MSPEMETMLVERERGIKLAILNAFEAGQSFDIMESNVRVSVGNTLDSVKPECNLCSHRADCVTELTLGIISDVIGAMLAVERLQVVPLAVSAN